MKAADAIDNAPKAIAILSFAVLIVTVLHDWGYFWVIGLRFQSVQTPYDHLTNSIEWLPYSLAYIGLSFGAFSGLAWLIGKEDFPEYPSGIGDRVAKKNLKWPMILFLLLNSGSAPLIWLFVSGANNVVTNVAAPSIVYLSIIMGLTHFVPSFRKRKFVVFIAVSPIFVTIAFATGAIEAEIALNSTENVYRLEINKSDPVTLILLRSLDKGVLVWDRAAKQVSLIRWEKIDRISHFTSTEPSSKPIICNYVKLLCFAEEPPIP